MTDVEVALALVVDDVDVVARLVAADIDVFAQLDVTLRGILYLLSVWLGYNQPDMAGHVHDYGTKFLVTAGLLNVLAMVDVFEIATGRKD